MTHREDKKETKRGSKKNRGDEAVTNQNEMKKNSTKGIIKGNE